MNKAEFNKYVAEKIASSLPEYSKKYLTSMKLRGDVERATCTSLENKEAKVLKCLVNYFDKLVEDLKNTSDKKLDLRSNPFAGDKLSPMDQQHEVYRALLNFLEVASSRKNDGVRSAYVSFSRQRKQKLVRPTEESDGGWRGRPNLYRSEKFRHVVNRAVKIKNMKALRSKAPKSFMRVKLPQDKASKVIAARAAKVKRTTSSRK